MARLASRGAIGLVIALATTGLGQAVRTGANEPGRATVFDWPRALDAGINDVVFAGVTNCFLLSIPERIRRRHGPC